MKYCENCQAELEDGAKFCSQCGWKVPEEDPVCPNCGTVAKTGSKFCAQCGASLTDSFDTAVICPSCGAALRKDAMFCDKCGSSVSDSCTDSADTSREKSDNLKVADNAAESEASSSGKIDELREIFGALSGSQEIWSVADEDGENISRELSSVEKKMILRMVTGGKYDEKDIVHIRVGDDFSAGWALTIDSFCMSKALAGEILNNHSVNATRIIYEDIRNINLTLDDSSDDKTSERLFITSLQDYDFNLYRSSGSNILRVISPDTIWQIGKFLEYITAGNSAKNSAKNDPLLNINRTLLKSLASL